MSMLVGSVAMFVLHTLAVVAIVLADQLSKAWVRHNMYTGESLPVIEGFFHLTHVQNSGAAFGILQNQTWVFIAAASMFLLGAFLYRDQLAQGNAVLRIGFTLGIAGATGNLIDRLFFGWVTDFFDFLVFPVFNIADIAITIGAVMIGWTVLTGGQENPVDQEDTGEALK